MSDDMYRHTSFVPYDVQQRKAARKKVIEAARKLERNSYKAMMQRRHRLYTADHLL